MLEKMSPYSSCSKIFRIGKRFGSYHRFTPVNNGNNLNLKDNRIHHAV